MKAVPPANPSDPRGLRTWEWHVETGKQITVFRRFRGETFGNHFHKGGDPSKNPERILLVSGTMEVELLDRNGAYKKEDLRTEKGPVEFSIEPWVLHRYRAAADCLYIEYRITRFDPQAPDTYPPEEFGRNFHD